MSETTSRATEVRHWDDLGYTVILEADDEYAHVVANFSVYEIVCEHVTERQTDGSEYTYERGYQRRGAAMCPDTVDNVALAERFLHGSVKWDGCSNWLFDHNADGCMLHFCEKEEAERIGVLLGRIYDWARELGMDRC